MKVLISVDMEGLQGLTHGTQTQPTMRDYEQGRRVMADSVNAVSTGCKYSGAESVTIADSHDGQRNIRAADLVSGVHLITGWPKELSMVEGIKNADRLYLLGYHPMAGTINGVLDHTFSTAVHRLWVNGQEMGEIGLSASVAGHFDVPVTFVAGDGAAVRESQKIIEEAEFVILKEGLSRYSANSKVPADAEKELEKSAANALKLKGKPFKVEGKVEIKLEFQNTGMADNCRSIPGISRDDGYTVSMEASNIIEGYKLFRVMLSLSSFDHGGY